MTHLRCLKICALCIMGCTIISCVRNPYVSSLQKELKEYVKDKDAFIGVAVIIDGKDTVAVNGRKSFPMLSVYKFPIAVALGRLYETADKMTGDTIPLRREDLKPDTYSPMRDKYEGHEIAGITLHEIIDYALRQSDNNASDILLRIMGGTGRAMEALKSMGFENINVVSTEAEMYEDNSLCYKNSSTPLAMAIMVDRFDREYNDAYSLAVKELLETCKTGGNRLVSPLAATGAVAGHKTGTGFTLPDGRLMAINDVGYIHLPDGRRYSIAVFIENSGYDMAATEKIIAEISEIVYLHINQMSR